MKSHLEGKEGRMEGLTQGVCLAVAELIRGHGQDTIAKEILDGAGITVVVMKQDGVDDYDFNVIKDFLKKEGLG